MITDTEEWLNVTFPSFRDTKLAVRKKIDMTLNIISLKFQKAYFISQFISVFHLVSVLCYMGVDLSWYLHIPNGKIKYMFCWNFIPKGDIVMSTFFSDIYKEKQRHDSAKEHSGKPMNILASLQS